MKARYALASLGALAVATAASGQTVAQINETGASAAGAGAAGPVRVPPTTLIVPDTEPGRTLGTVVSRVGNRHIVGGGTLAGPNLFHSFARFNLGRGDTAAWVYRDGDPAQIVNVISRVTGGERSLIYGTLDSTALPNADFWFINPAGVLFGEGATLNIPAAAHFSTAGELRFASGPAFTVATPSGSTLSVAAPTAFGFVGGERAIELIGVAEDFLHPADRLDLVASDIFLMSSSFGAGDLRLYGVGTGSIVLSVEDPRPTRLTGNVEIVDSVIALGGRPGAEGGLRVAGGTMSIIDSGVAALAGFDPRFGAASIDLLGGDVVVRSSFLSSATSGPADAGRISLAGDSIVIQTSFLTSEAAAGASGAAGDIQLVANVVTVEDGSFVTSATLSDRPGGAILIVGEEVDLASSVVRSGTDGGLGEAGAVTIMGGLLRVREEARISSGTSGDGPAGAVFIEMDRGVHLARGVISSQSTGEAFSGASGAVAIRTPVLTLDSASGISTSTAGGGEAGLVLIGADTILLANGSRIESRSKRGATGNAGLVLIQRLGAEPSRLVLDTGAGISSDTAGDGDAGGIFIEMDEIEVLEGTVISSSATLDVDDPLRSEIQGSAGAILIRANRLTVSAPRHNETGILTESSGRGDGGMIQLDVGRLEVLGESFISTDVAGTGSGGSIVVNADEIELGFRSVMSSSTNGAGDAGSIALNARRSLVVDTGSHIESESRLGSGRGGTIRINSPDTRVTGHGQITSTTFTSGAAGSIELRGGRLLVDSGGMITSSTHGEGRGGRVDVQVDEVTVAGGGGIDADSVGICLGIDCFESGPAGDVFVRANRVTVTGEDEHGQVSYISSDTRSEDDAGNVTIEAGELVVEGGRVGSSTRGRGNAGSVTIDADVVRLRGGGEITTSSEPEPGCLFCDLPTGHAGQVHITAELIDIGGGSLIASLTEGAGDAGAVGIDASSLILDDGRISTSILPGSSGRSGIIAIGARTIDLIGNSAIETISNNSNEAGGILIDADRLSITGPVARITSSNLFERGGDAGGMLLSVGTLSLIGGGRLTSSSVAGAAGSIQILMPDDAFLLLDSRGTPSLITTSSGPGRGGRIFISNPFAIISNGGSILALGEQGGANVQISTRFFISSADRANRVAVDGNFLLEAQVGDVSSGTVERDLSIVDASGVLRGQCAAVRATGQVSQLIVRPTGPYGTRPDGAVPPAGSCF